MGKKSQRAEMICPVSQLTCILSDDHIPEEKFLHSKIPPLVRPT